MTASSSTIACSTRSSRRPCPSRLEALPGKRSQLVADLAKQVQDHACQGDAEPVWGAPGSHPSTALIGEIAVWRAANGINPQDPRPTGGGGQLETLPTFWKQRLDRDIARATDQPADAKANERQTRHTALSRSLPDPRTASERAIRAQPIAHLNPGRSANHHQGIDAGRTGQFSGNAWPPRGRRPWRPAPRRTGATTRGCAGSGRRRSKARRPPCWPRRR